MTLSSISIWILFILFAILSFIVSNRLKTKFKKYSQVPVALTGKEVAQKMLFENGIYDVKVQSVQGKLTDHYNPLDKTVNLSQEVYYGNNVAAAAVAAHECGHAVQHATSYSWLMLRSKLVPVVTFASRWVQWVLLAGILLVESFPNLLLVGILMFAATTLFSIITLPVEINASQRALAWLDTTGLTRYDTHAKAQDALRWAAYTYVIAAISSLATLIYYIMIYMGSRD
ncbi:MAG: zinc metallopeptidase [Bacteroidales bacterium]|nr:zinc metallopeptidase [Bacteroidales bacterium]MBR3287676.1 zinc metallopeptidase [Bacteroidales bacterium]MCR5714024.1 zinc metallopeptidase [Bacteroidales bacterium]